MEKDSVHIELFRRTGCSIELHNRELTQPDREIKFCDDYIKPQGLVGKYAILLRIGFSMGISSGEVEHPETRESPEENDAIVDKENNNDFLGGGGEHEDLDEYQDVVEEDQGSLVPGGLDIG